MAFGAFKGFGKGPPGGFGGFGGKGGGPGGPGGPGGGYCEEDRSRDWQCPNGSCRERNFVKRPICFKCGTPRPAADAQRASQPPPKGGTTLHGMVKSYNKKGFGFIMCTGNSDIQDLYFTRENVSSRLLHPDMPGERVTFEIGYEGRRMVARNVRPFGEDKHTQAAMVANSNKARYERGYDEEDTSRDWNCPSCNERNFLKRNVCFKCSTPKPIVADPPGAPSIPRRTLSPHAGARAIREALAAAKAAPKDGEEEKEAASEESSSPSEKPKKEKKKRKKRRRKSSSGSSSSRAHKKKKAKKHKSKGGSSSSGGSVKSSRSKSSSSACVMEEPVKEAAVPVSSNPDIDKAKQEALEKLLKLKTVEPKEARMKEWRELLRQWHPDKNPQRIEVATAVFQFLQKGKPMLDGA
ncbi:unnamed protein product [Durusdinium trenchii]|uniref:Uncharacterized protein n=2 Tax=Durusdinium trenchii TaxID=1381693 RepID=A0ABP0HEX5_9DINO